MNYEELTESFSQLLAKEKYPLRGMKRFRNSAVPSAMYLSTAMASCTKFHYYINDGDQDFIRQATGDPFDVENIESFGSSVFKCERRTFRGVEL